MLTIGLAGAGTIGAGLLRLLATSPVARGIRVKTILVRDAARPRPDLPEGALLTTRAADLWEDPEVDAVVELLGGVDEAFRVVSASLAAGKPVVTANKNLLAERGPALFRLAAENRVAIGFEASVCAGMPLIRTLQEALRADRITSVEAIVNGTTNYLLTRMSEEHLSYSTCLAEAQRLGLAEPDPDYDVSGKDAACKTGILATLAGGCWVDYRSIPAAGIDALDLEDVRQSEAMGYRIKLVASVVRTEEGTVAASVGPVLLPRDHPLASVRREYNAALIESVGLGRNLLSGKGAGPEPTAVSLLADLLDLAEGRARVPSDSSPFLRPGLGPTAGSRRSRYYLRLAVPDRPGVLAQVAGLFGVQDISIASVLQPEAPEGVPGALVPLILTTHTAPRDRLDLVLGRLEAEGRGRAVVLPIQEV